MTLKELLKRNLFHLAYSYICFYFWGGHRSPFLLLYLITFCMSSRYFRELNLGDTVLNIVNITNCCCEVSVLKTVALEVSVTPKWNCFKQGSANLFYKGTCSKYFRLCVTNVV